jgi:hypothetical protein
MADPSPLGETSFRAIVRAIWDADPAKVRAGGCVESDLTVLTQRRVRFRPRSLGVAAFKSLIRRLVVFSR